jgi:hypothetical protein
VPESETVTRTCEKCGGEFIPRRMGRQRKFCANCTPRNDADRAAAREHWETVRGERAEAWNAAAREQSRAMRERIQAVVGS